MTMRTRPDWIQELIDARTAEVWERELLDEGELIDAVPGCPMKQLKRATQAPEVRAGDELLRALAGYATRSVHLGRDQIKHRIVQIHRDEFGRVVGSTERIEEIDHTSLDGDFLD